MSTAPAPETELTLAQRVERYEAALRDLTNIRKTVELAKRQQHKAADVLCAHVAEIVAHMQRDMKGPEESFTLPATESVQSDKSHEQPRSDSQGSHSAAG